MAEFHVYSQTVADGTATSVVRPSDWNSGHAQIVTLGGNTAGASTLTGTNIIIQGGNNLTVSGVQGANVATIIMSGVNTVAQTVDTNKAGTGFTSTTIAGAVVAATNDTNGLKLAVPGYLTTAQPVGAYLTTARASNDAIGLNTALTGNGVSVTANSSGLSINVPPFITTYVAQTTQTQPAGNIAGVGTTFAGTNVSATMGLNSNGLALSLSAPSGGGGAGFSLGVSNTGNTAGNTGTFSNSTYVLAGSGSITLSQSTAAGGATAWIQHPAWLTTAALSQNTSNYAGVGYTSTTQAGSTVGATHNTAGLSMAWPPFLTTSPAQTNQTLSFAMTGNTAGNASNATVDARSLTVQGLGIASVGWSTSAGGSSLIVSVPTGGGGGDGYNAAQFTNSTANSTMPLVWAGNSNGSGNITLGLTGSTVTGSAPSGGGAAGSPNSIFDYGFYGASTVGSVGQSSLYFQYMNVGDANSFCRMDHQVSISIAGTTSFTTSNAAASTSNANANTWSMGKSYCLYSQGTGTNSSRLESVAGGSTSVSLGGTRGYTYSFSINSNSVTHGATNGFSIGAVKAIDSAGGVTYTTVGYSSTVSNTASSAASITTTTGTTSVPNVSTSLHAGLRVLAVPWGKSIGADDYWLGFMHASSSTSQGTNSTVMSVSKHLMTIGSVTSFAHITNTGNSSNSALFPGHGVYSAATAAFPATVALSQINNNTSFSNAFFPGVFMNNSL